MAPQETNGFASGEADARTGFGNGASADAAALAKTARHDAEAVGETIGKDLDHLKDEAGAQIDELRHQAERQIGKTVEKAKGFAGDQKDVVARQLGGIADALASVAGELENGEDATIGRYARDMSKSVHGIARMVETNDVDQLLGRAEQFGRSQPVAFLAMAGLAGFAASRFLLASAQRRDRSPRPQSAADDMRPAYAGAPDGRRNGLGAGLERGMQ